MTSLSSSKPAIIVTQGDYERLNNLAESAARREVDAADELLTELDRARIVPDASAPDAVRMGSRVDYATNGGERRVVTLVYPPDADIDQGRISVLTPVGAALIGLSAGQSIAWTARDGRKLTLTVHAVEPPAPAQD